MRRKTLNPRAAEHVYPGMRFLRRSLIVLSAISVFVLGAGFTQLPALGAGALLHPFRRPVTSPPPQGCANTTFEGANVRLEGWSCDAPDQDRGTIVYLHGVGDNRTSAAGVIQRFRPRGFDVVAFDSRAHGQSDGDFCTYGFFEKDDLDAVIDATAEGPIVLIGASLGAAVALQHAARDDRIAAVVAAESFASLRRIAAERAPFFFTRRAVDRAIAEAEARAAFSIDAVSPVAAASNINAPVLLIHGAGDTDTSPDHTRHIFAALKGPKRLILVPRAGHNQSLQPGVWLEIERWLDDVLPRSRQ